jgi:hypothetical protein
MLDMGATARLAYGDDVLQEFKVEDYRSAPSKS